jgi:hypothetical protein
VVFISRIRNSCQLTKVTCWGQPSTAASLFHRMGYEFDSQDWWRRRIRNEQAQTLAWNFGLAIDSCAWKQQDSYVGRSTTRDGEPNTSARPASGRYLICQRRIGMAPARIFRRSSIPTSVRCSGAGRIARPSTIEGAELHDSLCRFGKNELIVAAKVAAYNSK